MCNYHHDWVRNTALLAATLAFGVLKFLCYCRCCSLGVQRGCCTPSRLVALNALFAVSAPRGVVTHVVTQVVTHRAES